MPELNAAMARGLSRREPAKPTRRTGGTGGGDEVFAVDMRPCSSPQLRWAAARKRRIIRGARNIAARWAAPRTAASSVLTQCMADGARHRRLLRRQQSLSAGRLRAGPPRRERQASCANGLRLILSERYSRPRGFCLRLIVLGAIVVWCVRDPRRSAQNYPWCSNFADGAGTNCGFATEAQCRTTVQGSGGYCDHNNLYQRPRYRLRPAQAQTVKHSRTEILSAPSKGERRMKLAMNPSAVLLVCRGHHDRHARAGAKLSMVRA